MHLGWRREGNWRWERERQGGMVTRSLMRPWALLRADAPSGGIASVFHRCVNLDAGEQTDRAGFRPLTKEVRSLGRGTAHRDLPRWEFVISSLREVTVHRTPLSCPHLSAVRHSAADRATRSLSQVTVLLLFIYEMGHSFPRSRMLSDGTPRISRENAFEHLHIP